MTELGDTQNLRRHVKTDDDRARFEALDRRVQRWGRWSVIAGVSIVIANTMGALVAALATENGLFEDETARLFAILAFVNISLGGVAGIIVGSIEKYQRPFRAYRTADADIADRHSQQIQCLALDEQERFDTMIGLAATLPGRIDSLEEIIDKRLAALERVVDKVPAYGEGVIHGVTMRRQCVDPPDN